MSGSIRVISYFEANGSPLAEHMRSMLLDEPKHHGERRGCGFSQSTRVLAQALHREAVRYGRNNALVEGPLPLPEAVRGWAASETGVWSIWLGMFAELIERNGTQGYAVATMQNEHKVGSCSMAEKYFLELAHGLMPRRGGVRIFCEGDIPVVIEKVGMGDPGSAISIAPICVESVTVPPGALLAVEHALPSDDLEQLGKKVAVYALGDIQARVLRLTTLVAEPEERALVFGPQLQHQFHNNFVSPMETRLSHLIDQVKKWRNR